MLTQQINTRINDTVLSWNVRKESPTNYEKSTNSGGYKIRDGNEIGGGNEIEGVT